MKRGASRALALAAAWCAAGACLSRAMAAEPPLTVVVMDPLAKPLSCACVKGYAQRDYDKLGQFLETKLGRAVRIVYGEDLARALRSKGGDVDLILGKASVVRYDAAELKLPIRLMCMLTDKQGSTTLTGLIVVKAGDAAQTMADLKGYTIFFGTQDSDEKHAAAAAALRKAGVELPATLETRAGCSDAALAVLEHQPPPGAAAVISSYAEATLKGCGVIEEGSLRIVGQTEPVPFISVFATSSLNDQAAAGVLTALLAVGENKELSTALETKLGFVKPAAEKPAVEKTAPPARKTAATWPGWRGPNRDGLTAWLPQQLPKKPRVVWTATLNGPVPAGIAADERVVITADRDLADQDDVFLCYAVADGKPQWQIQYPAPGKLDYGNAPRATPLLADGRVYLLGAMGDLHCADVADGRILWKRNLAQDFGAKLPTWGMSASPLLVDGRLIVNPGAKDASLAALDPATGKTLWQSPGLPAAYGSLIVGTFGGVRQIVGYDAASLGGWDPATGVRLWSLVPPGKGDFNVPTPIDAGGRLLVTSESNGTRLYGFDRKGRIIETPLAMHKDLAADASTAVVAGGKAFGCWNHLYCLDLGDGLKELWQGEDDAFQEYASLVASGSRLLMTTLHGELLLLDTEADKCSVVSRLKLFNDVRMLAHPALVGHLLFVRGGQHLACISLDP